MVINNRSRIRFNFSLLLLSPIYAAMAVIGFQNRHNCQVDVSIPHYLFFGGICGGERTKPFKNSPSKRTDVRVFIWIQHSIRFTWKFNKPDRIQDRSLLSVTLKKFPTIKVTTHMLHSLNLFDINWRPFRNKQMYLENTNKFVAMSVIRVLIFWFHSFPTM